MSEVPSFIDISERMSLETIFQRVNKIKDIAKQANQSEEDLEKSMKALKNLATTVAMLQAAHYIGKGPDQAQIKAPREPAAQEKNLDEFGVPRKSSSVNAYKMKPHEFVDHIKEAHPHLWAISKNESSGGQNLKHETMKDGMHKGHTAGGPWGMMPNTVKFVVNNLDKDGHIGDVYPYLKNYTKDTNKNHKTISDMLNSSPIMSFHLASRLYDHLNDAHKGDPERVAHSWYNGLNGTKKTLKNSGDYKIDSHPYVKKFSSHLKELKDMKKALTAGYGGAGAPTSMTGGSVMQSESLGDSRAFGGAKKGKLSYITCDKCGHEQVHAANQVKCRECNSSFSLEKLYRTIIN